MKTCTFMKSRSIILRTGNISDEVVEKIKTHIVCSITFFPKIVPLMRYFWKIWQSREGHRWHYETAHAPCVM